MKREGNYEALCGRTQIGKLPRATKRIAKRLLNRAICLKIFSVYWGILRRRQTPLPWERAPIAPPRVSRLTISDRKTRDQGPEKCDTFRSFLSKIANYADRRNHQLLGTPYLHIIIPLSSFRQKNVFDKRKQERHTKWLKCRLDGWMLNARICAKQTPPLSTTDFRMYRFVAQGPLNQIANPRKRWESRSHIPYSTTKAMVHDGSLPQGLRLGLDGAARATAVTDSKSAAQDTECFRKGAGAASSRENSFSQSAEIIPTGGSVTKAAAHHSSNQSSRRRPAPDSSAPR